MTAFASLFLKLHQFIQGLFLGNHQMLGKWLADSPKKMLLSTLPCIICGCGLYGFSMGFWHGWEMGIYVALKLPLLIFFTLIINGLLNGLLAQVLDSGVSMRQSIQFLLTGFAAMAIILGSLSTITIAMAMQAPDPSSAGSGTFHAAILLFHTALIAYAGIVSHLTLLAFLKSFCNNTKAAISTFLAWLAGNLFVGAQLSWIMRPFFGSPHLEVSLLRDDPFHGTFYETLWHTALHFF